MDTKVFRNLSYGVYVTTSLDHEKPVGCVTNSVMQITSSPATIAVSINHENYTNQCIMKSRKFAVSILPEQTDSKIIGTFGFHSSSKINKFENIAYHLENEIPVLDASCGNILCEVIDTIKTDTHTVFLGKVIDTSNYKENTPMTYRYYHQELKGTSPKKAPTYVEEKVDESSSKKRKWKCKICGYVYEGDELPETYICPICGQPHTAFEEIKTDE